MILCCGEALIDMIPVPKVVGAPHWAGYTGGAVFNTAIALARLQQPSGLMTGLSSDTFGEMLKADLRDAGVDMSLSVHSDRKTALAFVTLTDGHATYSFHDEGSAMRMIVPEDLPPLPDSVQALFFGGISLVEDPCASTMEGLLSREAGRRVTMMDPNVRPAFIADPDGYRARIRRMMGLCDIVKVSDEDLDWLQPGPEGLEDKMALVQALGPSIVLVTRGADGALGRMADGTTVTVPARKAVVVDTVGAGDTFNAGFLAQLGQAGLLTRDAVLAMGPEALKAAMAMGGAAAAVVVARAGAEPPRLDELSL